MPPITVNKSPKNFGGFTPLPNNNQPIKKILTLLNLATNKTTEASVCLKANMVNVLVKVQDKADKDKKNKATWELGSEKLRRANGAINVIASADHQKL